MLKLDLAPKRRSSPRLSGASVVDVAYDVLVYFEQNGAFHSSRPSIRTPRILMHLIDEATIAATVCDSASALILPPADVRLHLSWNGRAVHVLSYYVRDGILGARDGLSLSDIKLKVENLPAVLMGEHRVFSVAMWPFTATTTNRTRAFYFSHNDAPLCASPNFDQQLAIIGPRSSFQFFDRQEYSAPRTTRSLSPGSETSANKRQRLEEHPIASSSKSATQAANSADKPTTSSAPQSAATQPVTQDASESDALDTNKSPFSPRASSSPSASPLSLSSRTQASAQPGVEKTSQSLVPPSSMTKLERRDWLQSQVDACNEEIAAEAKSELDATKDELARTVEQKQSLEQALEQSNAKVVVVEKKLVAATRECDTVKRECDTVKRERDGAFQERDDARGENKRMRLSIRDLSRTWVNESTGDGLGDGQA